MTTAVRQSLVEERVVNHVHDDDVHALCKIESRRGVFLVSGSKDCTVRSHDWPLRGGPGTILSQPAVRKYDFWITALDLFHDGSLVAGSRNGHVRCMDLARKNYYRGFPLEQIPDRFAACKDRNRNRIMSIFCLKDPTLRDRFHALIGYSGFFCQFDLTAHKIERTFDFSLPQWIYGFCPIRVGHLVAIHGAHLSLLRETPDSWEVVAPLVRGPRVGRGEQIPFISSVFGMKTSERVTSDVSSVALSYFGGRTEVRDVETARILHHGHEHTNRVWQSIPFAPHCYASCSDDRTIKIWDMRESRGSVATSPLHPGRVSVLCFMSPTSFVAGTCPDDLGATTERASFYCYDLRALPSERVGDRGELVPPTPAAVEES